LARITHSEWGAQETCRVIKIDIEGMELITLESMQRDALWCDTYVVEWSPVKWSTYGFANATTRGAKVMNAFVAHGYALGLTTNTGLNFARAGGRLKAWGQMPAYKMVSTEAAPITLASNDATFSGQCGVRCDMIITRDPRAFAMLQGPAGSLLAIVKHSV
jgi:hypothetical protein